MSFICKCRALHVCKRVVSIVMLTLLAMLMASIFSMTAGNADGDGSYGTTAGETILTVYSQCSGSYIELYSEWGRCRVEGRTVADIYVQERSEYHSGFYYLYIYHGNECKIVPWAPAATTNKDRAETEDRIRIRFNDVGEYKIYVEPMCTEDINTYWIHDRFLYWERDANWYVCANSDCTYGNRLYDHGTITVSCYSDGVLLESYQVTITGSQTLYPKQIAGYTINSSAWVEFDSATGLCDPSTVNFYYQAESGSDYTEANDSSWESGSGYEDINGSGWESGYEQPLPEDSGYSYNDDYTDNDSYYSDDSNYTNDSYGSLQCLPGMNWPAYVTDPYVEYIKPQCGPGDQYQTFRAMDGNRHLYDPRKIVYANICFTVGDWDYVEYQYVNTHMYGFFRNGVFTPEGDRNMIPEYSLNNERCGTIVQETNPYNAPDYSSGEFSSCSLRYGDAVYACMESNGWYFCRFYNDHDNYYGDVYLWIPGDAINFW